jgi:RNA polymerase sigma factor (sigma-70 family)
MQATSLTPTSVPAVPAAPTASANLNLLNREDLVQANLRLARYGVRRFLNRYRIPPSLGLDVEDLVSEAYVALCNAAETWNPARGTFATYAGVAIHNQLLKVCGLARGSTVAQFEFVSLDAPVNASGDERLADILVDPRRSTWEPVDPTWIAVQQAIGELPDRDQRVIVGLLAGASIAAIARYCNCSRQRIKQIQSRAYHRLRLSLAGEPVATKNPRSRGGMKAAA